MMSRLIDISVRVHPGMTVWPDSTGIRLEQVRSHERGDDVMVSRLDMDVHCGTHVEAPLHFLPDGSALDSYALETFIGPAHVVALGDADIIGPAELDAARIPDGASRVLLQTRNSTFWQDGLAPFRTDFVGLSPDGAAWIVDREIRLIGADYLSIAPYDIGPETHRILMRGGVAILEGLNLRGVRPGLYRLWCGPLRLAGTEAAPARAALEEIS
jgi:arylformamidase